MSVDEGAPGAVVVTPGTTGRWRRVRIGLAVALVWLGGSAIVALAQSSHERRVTAAASAAAGIAMILAVTAVTKDPGRRYFRSVVGTIVALSLVASWLVRRLGIRGVNDFSAAAAVERIVIPLAVVLLLPLVVEAGVRRLARPRELWVGRAALLRSLRAMDWIVVAYATVILLPGLLLGLARHNHLSFIGQDLGLVVFFSFMYLVGRGVDAETGRNAARELIDVLLLVAAAQLLLFGWGEVEPLYIYLEATCAGALAIALLRPRQARLLTIGLAVTLLAVDGVDIRDAPTTGSSLAVDLAIALALLAYVAVRIRRLVPQWLIIGLAAVALVGFIGFTSNGAALRGQYHGPDPSNRGRTYEAHQVRTTIRRSPLSTVLGRGFGGTIDERTAPKIWKAVLVSGGRDLAQVQEIHPLPYLFLLKSGFLGLAWFFAFLLGLAVLGVRALERAARDREPSLVLYAAIPVVGVVQAFAAATHLQANPLIALTLGILVSCVAAPTAAAQLPERRDEARSSAAS